MTKTVFLLVLGISLKIFPQWTLVSDGLTNALSDIYFINKNIGFSVGIAWTSPGILKTSNGGNDWILIATGVNLGITLNGIDFYKDSLGIIVGDHGCILRTSNGGDTWEEYSIQYSRRLFGVAFVDSNTVVAVGGQGTFNPYGYIYRSTNSGMSWNNIVTNNDSPLMAVDFLNDTLGIAIGWAKYYLTTDKGLNWVSSPINGNYYAVDFIDENTIYTVGYGGAINKTTNLGQTWNSQISNTTDLLMGVYFTDLNNGTIVSLLGNVLQTEDAGVNWINNSAQLGVLNSVYFLNKDTGFVVGAGRIFKTISGGKIPVDLINFTSNLTDCLCNLEWNTLTEINNQGFEIERSANKNDWIRIGFREGKGTTTEQQNYSFTDDINGINVPKLFYRLKQIDFDGSYKYSDIVEVIIAPIKFSLSQNYPNPFNPSTKISWQSPVSGHQTLKIYDVLGREVATLVNEYRDAGSYEVEFDGSQLASGVYYYQLKVGDLPDGKAGFVETRKMILMK